MFARFSNLLCKPFSCKAETLFFHLGYAETWLYAIGNEGIDCEEDKHYFARHLAQVRLLQERDDCSPLVKRKGCLPFIGSSWCWVFQILRLIHPNVLIMDPWVLLFSYSWLWHRKLSRLYIVSFVVLSHLSLSNELKHKKCLISVLTMNWHLINFLNGEGNGKFNMLA